MNITEIFNLAIQNHKKNKLEEAQNFYDQVLKINPEHSEAIYNLGVIFLNLKKYQKTLDYFKKAIEINPNYVDAHYNLAIALKALGENQKALDYFKKAIEINPNYVGAHFNQGNIYKELGDPQKAKDCYDKAIEINPNYTAAHNNLGNIYKELGDLQKAKDCYHKAIELNPNYTAAHNNLGVVFNELGDLQKAKDCYHKAIELNPNFADAHWNSHSLSTDIDEALSILKKLYKIDNKYTKAKIMIAALEGYKGNFNYFNDILKSDDFNHPYTRSIKWVFSLPKLPNIFFNRWLFFDAVIRLSENSRPFYEFGVWNGVSFQYLINTFKKGFGFDTFNGLPEVWHNNKTGTYSAFGSVPKIKGGEFIVGKFEETLSKFFLKNRPTASLINFDADLYSSTLCALNNSKKVIDEKTILIFDEFIMNKNWEKDEYKALNDFCSDLSITYEVLAVSLYTKQVAVKLKKIK